MSAHRPNRCTGSTPTVRGVRSASSCRVSRLKVARSTSQKTGFAPMYSTTLAVETQVKAGTITSSPGFSPSAATARCSAVVQELVATLWGAPVNAENFCSNSLTYGPCTTQPLSSGRCTARSSSGPKTGFVIGMLMPASPRRRGHLTVLPPPLHHRAQSFLQRHRRPEAEQPFGLLGTADAVRDEHLLLRPVLGAELRTGQPKQVLDQLVNRGLDAHADVEELVGHVGLHGEDVRPGDVGDVDEVVGLRAVAEDDRRQALRDAVEHLHDDADIGALVVHARAVDVHVAQADVRQLVLFVHRPEELLA